MTQISRLLRRLWQRSAQWPNDPPVVPEGQRIYAIGDVHGRADLLQILLSRVAHDARNMPISGQKTVIYLGDYIDRGLDSKRVIDLLLGDSLVDFRKIHLKGNHEDLLLRFLDDPAIGPAWFAIGGAATVLSYNVRLPEGIGDGRKFSYIRDALREKMPEVHYEFLQNLQLAHEAGDYVFVHAGVKPGIALDKQEAAALLWIRDEFLNQPHGLGKVVVHGHSHAREPEIHADRIGIDTGAYATNNLTCLILEGTSFRFLSTGLEGID